MPKRAALAAVFLLVCISAIAAPADSWRDEDAKFLERLHRPSKIPSWVPEDQRDFYLATEDISRELRDMRPLFTRLGVDILQEIKQLEQRPEGGLGEWAAAMHRRFTSWAGIAATIVLIQSIGGRDGTEGMSPDEREVHLGGVQMRLVKLAITGRITKEEYDGLVKRLQGN